MLPPAGRREPCRLIRVAGAMGERRPRRASLLHRLVFSRQQADPHRELSRTRRGPRSRRAVGVPTAERRGSGNALETADRSNTRGRWFETSRAHRPDGRRAGFFTPLASLLVRNQPRPSLFLLASRAFAALGVGRPSCASHASRPAPCRSLPEPAGAAASDARIDWSLSR